MARSRARIALALALVGALAVAVPGDAAPAQGRKVGVPVLVTFLAGSYANIDAGAGGRQVPLTGYALGYVARPAVDRTKDVPIVLVRAEAFPQGTDLVYDSACGEYGPSARLDPATTITLGKGGGGARLHPGGSITAKAQMSVRLKLDLRAPDGCGQPLQGTPSVTSVASFGLTGRAGSSRLDRLTMTARARSYTLRACLTPGTGARCAGRVQKLTAKIGLHLLVRVEIGVGGGRWSYPG